MVASLGSAAGKPSARCSHFQTKLLAPLGQTVLVSQLQECAVAPGKIVWSHCLETTDMNHQNENVSILQMIYVYFSVRYLGPEMVSVDPTCTFVRSFGLTCQHS